MRQTMETNTGLKPNIQHNKKHVYYKGTSINNDTGYLKRL